MAVGAARWLWAAIAAALVILPAFPIPSWVGAPDPGPLWSPHVEAWGIGLLVVVTVGVLAGRLAASMKPMGSWLPRVPVRWILIALALVSVGASLGSMFFVFAGNPHLVDEFAQLFHAQAFAAGRIAAPVPDLPEFFQLIHTFMTDGGWVSQYLPGHTALLAAGLWAGVEWLVPPLLGGAGVVLIFYVARGLYGPKTGLIAAVLWALSPWVAFMSGTYMNHVSEVALLLAGWAALLGPRRPRPIWGLLGGVALAGAAVTRPLDAAVATLPLVLWVVLARNWKQIAWVVVGGAPVMLAVVYLNWSTYGDPFTVGYTALWGPEHRMGFHTDPWGQPFTPLVAMSNLAAAIRRLNIYLYEWPIPALLPVAVWALAARPRFRSDLVLGLATVAIPFAYFFYWHSGFYLGPRFYYAAAPFLLLATARAWKWAAQLARRHSTPHLNLRVGLATAAIVTFVWGAVGILPSRVEAYREGLPTMKLHPERELRTRGVQQALVLVPEGWGTRVIVDLWSRGLSMGLVERAYRQLDTCELYQLGNEFRRARLPSAEIKSRLTSLVERATEAPPRIRDLPDPTVRLRPRELPVECANELRRDLEGITLYGNLGWRNAPTLDRGIVFARDFFERNEALLASYPGWEVWRWAPPKGQPNARPSLSLVRPADSTAAP